MLDDDFGLRTEGGLLYVHTEAQLVTLREFVERRQADGVDIRLIDGDEARSLAPILPDTVIGASYCPLDAQMESVRYVRAFANAAARHGATIVERAPVRSLEREGSRIARVVTDAETLHTRGGRRRRGRLDAGAPSTDRCRDPDPRDAAPDRPDDADGSPARSGPVRPGGGQAVPDLPRAAVVPARRTGQTKPRTDTARRCWRRSASGRTGRTCSAARWTIPASSGSPIWPVSRWSARACPAIMPMLRSARFAGAWAGILPFTTDNLPIIDALPGFDDAYIAAGHVFGNGAGPTTGRLVAEPRLRRRADHGHDAVPCGPAGALRSRGHERVVTMTADSSRRIAFINPFGTAAFDEIIEETLVPVRGRRDAGRRHPPRRRAREHRLLLPQAPHGAGDLPGRPPARGAGLRRGRGRLLLRPGRQGGARARRHPGRRAARGSDEPCLVLRPSVHGDHRPSQGRPVARGPRAAPRDDELPRRTLPSTGTSRT